MDSHESLQKSYSGCLQAQNQNHYFVVLLHSIGKIWVAVRLSYFFFFFHFHVFIYFYCSPVLILLLKIPKVSEYLSINRKQLNVAIFADGSRRVRSVYIGAGHSQSRKEWSFQNCSSGVSILDWFLFPFSNISFPCISLHFLPVSIFYLVTYSLGSL